MTSRYSWRSRLPPLVVGWVEEMLVPEMRRLEDCYPALSLREHWLLMDPAVAATLRRYARAYPCAFKATPPSVT